MEKELYDIVANVWVEAEKSATTIERVALKDAGLIEAWFPLTLDRTLLWKSPKCIPGLGEIKRATIKTNDIATKRYFLSHGNTMDSDPIHAIINQDTNCLKYKCSDGTIRTFKAVRNTYLYYDQRTMDQYQEYVRKKI